MAVTFVPAARTQLINLLNDTAKAIQEIKYLLFMFPVSLCLFEVIWVDSLIIFKIPVIINFNEFIILFTHHSQVASSKLD